MPGYKPNVKGHPRQIKDAAKLINEARQPVIYAGGGIMLANASNELRALAELTGIPTVTTLMGRGALPDEHPLCLGMPGMHGNYTAVTAMQKADLLITLGARFDDRVTGKVSTFAPDAKVIHVDIDPAELGKVRHADVPIVGDVRTVIDEMIKALKAERAKHEPPDLAPWMETLHGWQDELPAQVHAGRGRAAQAAVRHRAAARQHARRLHPRVGRRSAPDVGESALEVQAAEHVGELRRSRHDGLRGSRGGRREGRPARPHGVGHRRRRLFPDDRAGARHRRVRAHPGEDRDLEQRVPRNGAAVAGALLRGALQRGVPVARPARLREVGRGDGLRRHARRQRRRCRRHDREGERDRRPSGRDRLPHRLAREGVPDGCRGFVERRHHPRSRSSERADDDAQPRSITSSRSPSRTSPACCRASRDCSRGARSTSCRSRSARPTTNGSRA